MRQPGHGPGCSAAKPSRTHSFTALVNHTAQVAPPRQLPRLVRCRPRSSSPESTTTLPASLASALPHSRPAVSALERCRPSSLSRLTPNLCMCHAGAGRQPRPSRPGPTHALIHTRMRSAIAGLDQGEFTEGHDLDRKWRVPKEMVGRRLRRARFQSCLRPLGGRGRRRGHRRALFPPQRKRC